MSSRSGDPQVRPRRARPEPWLLAALALALPGCGGNMIGGDVPDEVCDGVDNDHDDQVDEGFECARGSQQACTLPGTDCTGQTVCGDDCSWSACDNPDWSCTSPGDATACTGHGSCTGTATCQDDCSLATCDDPAWECTAPGTSESCLVGACTGSRECAADCSYATCVADCDTGASCCGDGCVDLLTDGANCGACDRSCTDDDCHGGACCLESCRNGSEICDDQAFQVPSPYVTMYLVCRNGNGGVAYVATNTGPMMSDGVYRCQGWEENGQNAWDYLDYVVTLICNTAGQQIEVDLSAYAGSTLYVGAHDLPEGGGHMTDVCIAAGSD